MNWSRGLFRAWVAFTALWLGLCGFILVTRWPEPTRSTTTIPGGTGLFDDLIPKKPQPNVFDLIETREHVLLVSKFAIIPPAILFALGWGLLWVLAA